jgi:hypothetical protein
LNGSRCKFYTQHQQKLSLCDWLYYLLMFNGVRVDQQYPSKDQKLDEFKFKDDHILNIVIELLSREGLILLGGRC